MGHPLRVRRYPRLGLPLSAVLGLGLCALALSACGSSSRDSAAIHRATQAGARIYTRAGCGGCHTLAAARSSGDVGPNLDTLKPSYAAVYNQVRNGLGGMPSYQSQLTQAQIASVARYVASVT